MADERATLIFVSGPQKGQRLALRGGVVLAGRSPTAGIQLAEDYVSREQMQFALTSEGWTVENLSPNRTRINGKKYRAGKKVLLDTGDVLGVGALTQILFVASGGDCDAALSAWAAAGGAEAAELVAPAAEVIGEVELTPATADRVPLYTASPEAERAAKLKAPKEGELLPEEEEEAKKRKAKVKKYAILGTVYLAVLVTFLIVISKVSKKDEDAASDAPTELKRSDIDDVIESKFDPTPNDAASQTALTEALRLWSTKRMNPGNLYKCVKHFKMSVAYSPSGALHDPQNARLFTQAKDELKKELWDTYEDALVQSRAKAWRKAKFLFERLLRMVPAKDLPNPERNNRLFENIIRHITYTQTQLDATKKSG